LKSEYKKLSEKFLSGANADVEREVFSTRAGGRGNTENRKLKNVLVTK